MVAGRLEVREVKALFLETARSRPLSSRQGRPRIQRWKSAVFRGWPGATRGKTFSSCSSSMRSSPGFAPLGEAPCFIKDWPASLTAMAKKKDDHTVERFELYMNGLEIANGYTELLDAGEQRARLSRDNARRAQRGMRVFPLDEQFLDALGRIRATPGRRFGRHGQAPHGALAQGADRGCAPGPAHPRIEAILPI